MMVINGYEKRIGRYTLFLDYVNYKIKRNITAKILTVFAGLAILAALFTTGNRILGAGTGLALLILYIYLDSIHTRQSNTQRISSSIIEINKESMARLNRKWVHFKDTGSDLAENNHAYSVDLDILGRGSVFQYINTAVTPWGRRKLKDWLLTTPDNPDDIFDRQRAVAELSEYIGFRQRLQAEGMDLKKKDMDIEKILVLGKNTNDKMLNPWVFGAIRGLPFVTVSCGILGYFAIIPYAVPAVLVIIQFMLLRVYARKRSGILNSAYALKYKLSPFGKMLKVLEKQRFTASYLINLKQGLYHGKNLSPSMSMHRLSRICESISSRNNMFYFIYNILTLWDYQCWISLEKWKRDCGRHLCKWLETIGEFEALSGLAILRHDNPNWAMPKLDNSPSLHFEAEQIGHPLLDPDRVTNNIRMDDKCSIILVTGSNMSGKSTFLRTLGLNLVLANAGAPVCASRFNASLMNIYTCMRVTDNLEKNISSFYAELLRIKAIVDAVKEKGRVFFLLDEIFKGTNSIDRHHAANVLVTKLSSYEALGLVSTHDLELGVLEKQSGGTIKNYHFQEQYIDDKISFDYKLRPGLSATRNAMYLIKAAGIDID